MGNMEIAWLWCEVWKRDTDESSKKKKKKGKRTGGTLIDFHLVLCLFLRHWLFSKSFFMFLQAYYHIKYNGFLWFLRWSEGQSNISNKNGDTWVITLRKRVKRVLLPYLWVIYRVFLSLFIVGTFGNGLWSLFRLGSSPMNDRIVARCKNLQRFTLRVLLVLRRNFFFEILFLFLCSFFFILKRGFFNFA